VKKGNGQTTLYPTREVLPERRKCLETIEHAEEANRMGKSSYGVKGSTIAMLIPQFDLITGFVPDYMHCVLLGVVRSFVSLWFDSCSHDKPYNVHDINLFDTTLIS